MYNTSVGAANDCFVTYYKQQNNGEDFLDLSIARQYIVFVYFTSSAFSSNTYNIVIPKSIAEETFAFIIILVSRLLLAFLLAESSSLIGSLQKPYISQMAKVNLINE